LLGSACGVCCAEAIPLASVRQSAAIAMRNESPPCRGLSRLSTVTTVVRGHSPLWRLSRRCPPRDTDINGDIEFSSSGPRADVSTKRPVRVGEPP
jgi:hypothetical protein